MQPECAPIPTFAELIIDTRRVNDLRTEVVNMLGGVFTNRAFINQYQYHQTEQNMAIEFAQTLEKAEYTNPDYLVFLFVYYINKFEGVRKYFCTSDKLVPMEERKMTEYLSKSIHTLDNVSDCNITHISTAANKLRELMKEVLNIQ